MFVSFQIILESRISDKWYTFRSESTILEYFKFCKPFLKPSPPKTSSSTHLSCFTNYKLLHKERLLDVQNPPPDYTFSDHLARQLSCNVLSSPHSLLGQREQVAIWNHSPNHGTVRSEAMSCPNSPWGQKSQVHTGDARQHFTQNPDGWKEGVG